MIPNIRSRVLAVYAAADAAVAEAGPRCESSGRCCRFTEYGHTLFLSQLEAEILLEAAPAYDQPVTRDGCPFQVNNLCTARDPRPIGCRVYFCDPSYQDRMSEIIETAIAELKAIADEFGTGWSYAPLHTFLNEAKNPPHPPRRGDLPLRGGSEKSVPLSTSPPEGEVDSRSESAGGDPSRITLPMIEPRVP